MKVMREMIEEEGKALMNLRRGEEVIIFEHKDARVGELREFVDEGGENGFKGGLGGRIEGGQCRLAERRIETAAGGEDVAPETNGVVVAGIEAEPGSPLTRPHPNPPPLLRRRGGSMRCYGLEPFGGEGSFAKSSRGGDEGEFTGETGGEASDEGRTRDERAVQVWRGKLGSEEFVWHETKYCATISMNLHESFSQFMRNRRETLK